MLKKITCILISFILVFTLSISVFADTKSEIQQKKEEAQDKKEEVSEEKSYTMQEIEDLSLSIEENENKLDKLSDELSTLSTEIENLKTELVETQKKYDEQDELLQDRITAQYEAGETTYLDVILNSTSFSDFLSNYFLVSEILENDSDLLSSIEEQKLKIEKDKQSLEDKQKDLKTKKAEQEKTQVVLNNQKVQKQNKVSSLSEKEKKLQEEIDKYTAELKRIAQNDRKRAEQFKDQYNTNISGSGILAWPVTSRNVTSEFGSRSQPIAGASTNHRGMDIGVSIGTSVYASADGVVVSVAYSGARGLYVLVKHGSSLYTRYQHLSSAAVSAGQEVKKGQLIAYSGNSGVGTGPHLHFEVLTSPSYGSEVNPRLYL